MTAPKRDAQTPKRILDNLFVYDSEQKIALDARLQNAASNGETVCAVGESITAGTEYDDELFGRYEGLIQSADMGVDGNTSWAVWLRRTTILATNANVYLLAIGVNDIRYNYNTISSYLTNIGNIVSAMQATGADVFVLSIWPSWTADVYPATGNQCGSHKATIAEIKRRNNALRKWCIDNDVPFINSTRYVKSIINTLQLEQTYSSDGIHPNASGRVIYADGCLNDPT